MTAVPLRALVEFLDSELGLASFPGDASNNGLQIEGASEVRKAAFAVDASGRLFAEAARLGADFLFVHHGMSWGAGMRRIRGALAARVSALLSARMSLYAAHLPLDAHPELGNNATLLSAFAHTDARPFAEYGGRDIGWACRLADPLRLGELALRLDAFLDRLVEDAPPSVRVAAESLQPPRLHGDPDAAVANVGFISGGAGVEGLEAAAEAGLDALVTGEFIHEMHPLARDTGVAVAALGHYKTETCGVLQAMRRVQGRFGIECHFIHIPSGL